MSNDTRCEVAFVWHMHQPPYHVGDAAPVLPWVRLHAVKAYHDMAWLLGRYPDVRAVFNFTPSLLRQLDAHASGGVRDAWYDLSARPAAALDLRQRAFLLQHFFSLNWPQLVDPHPTYRQLLDKRGRATRGAPPQRVVDAFSEQDLRDLQVLFNLHWCGFAARETFPELKRLATKGHYDEADKALVLEIHDELVARIVPMYRALAERGQVELTTTPLNHPILPLLCDTNVAVERDVDRPLPPRFAWPSDAAAQVARGIEIFEKAFGFRPIGMWPAEGAVSDEALAILADHGIRWVATDEQILYRSQGMGPRRGGAAHRPYALQTPAGPLSVLFRDTTISDLIGFQYRNSPPRAAAADLLARLEAAARSTEYGREPHLVSVILDGENPWEHYPNDGRAFLEALYGALGASKSVVSICPGQRLASRPPTRTLHHIHAGSWIEADFPIWIGHPTKNQAWRVLGQVREAVARAIDAGGLAPDLVSAALDDLYRAEASDWFWWYGPYFNSDQDEIFDQLFRDNLRAALTRLGLDVPDVLDHPIAAEVVTEGVLAESEPQRHPIHPRVDGDCLSYFDWMGAGVYAHAGSQTAMFQHRSAVERVWFGRDAESAYFRFDFDRSTLQRPDVCFEVDVDLRLRGKRFVIEFSSSEPTWLRLSAPSADSAGPPADRLDSVSLKRSLVLAVPLELLGAGADDALTWSARMISSGIELARVPQAGSLALAGLSSIRKTQWFV